MSDEPDSLVLRYLRRIDQRTEKLETDMREVKERLGGLEHQMSLVHRDLAGLHADVVRLDQRIDRVDVRLERIEKRLDLVSI